MCEPKIMKKQKQKIKTKKTAEHTYTCESSHKILLKSKNSMLSCFGNVFTIYMII